MIVCHCIKKKYKTDDAVIFEVGNEYYYNIDRQGDIWVYKHMSKYADEIFESLEEFHKYFKDY